MDPITGFLINLIIGVILSAASTLLSQAFGPKEQKRTGTRGSAQIGGKVPQYFLIGTVGEAGKLEYQNAWGNDGEVPNAYLTNVLSFGDLSITRMIGMFVNGVRVTFVEADPVAQGYPVPEYPSNLWWKFFDGTQTTADSYLVDKFGGDADRPWASDMVGRGVPYLITTALWSETLWTGFPSFVGEFEGIRLYDPRQDTTAGGSGSQRWGNPSTWEFSDNNAVIIYNIERGIYYNQPGATTLGTKVWGGSSTQAQLPYAPWAAAMDACDEVVVTNIYDEAGEITGTSTEKRFRAGRRINLNERPAEVIKEFLIGANMRISHASDGTVYPLVGVPDEADGAFSDADVLASEPLGSIPFPNLDSIINGATATYREPMQAWEDKETAPYYRSDLEAEDDGRQQVEGLDLGTTFSGTQAQRVIKAVIEEGRRFKTHVVVLPPEFAQYRPLQVLAWTSTRFDYEGKLFLITARTRTPWGQVVFGLQEVDPADHNWVPSTDEQPLSFTPVVPNRPTPQVVSGPSVAPVPGQLAFDVFWSAPSVAVDVDFVRVTYRLPGDDDSRITIPIPKPDLLTGSARVPVSLSLSNTPIEVQIEYIPGSGRPMVASAWMPVTIANVRIGPDDLTDELNEVFDDIHDFLDTQLPAITDELSNIQAQLADIAAAPDYDNGVDYDVGAIVKYDGGLYRMAVDAPAGTLPTDTDYWEKIGDYASIGEAVAALAAQINDTQTEVTAVEGKVVSATRDTRRIHNSLLMAAMLNSEQGSGQVIENANQLEASATVSQTMQNEVSRIDGVTTAQATLIQIAQAAITVLEGAVSTKAEATALNALQAIVTEQGGILTATATGVTSLKAALGGNSADVNVKFEAQAAPSGYSARYAIRCSVNEDGVYRQASIFIDVPAAGGGKTRIGFSADDTVFFDSLGNAIALMNGAGEFRSANGAVVINMLNGNFSFG
jgi:hypothetical protein